MTAPIVGREATPAEASAVIDAVNSWEPVLLGSPTRAECTDLVRRGAIRPLGGGQDA